MFHRVNKLIMKKAVKTILIISITIFSAGFLFINSAKAQGNLFVEFEKTPLFKEADFKPGDCVTRWVKVTNNSSEAQNIAVEAINYPGFPNPDNVPVGDLSRALSIIIREKNGDDLYGGSTGEKTLYDFYRKYGFNATYEHVLTFNLPSGNTKTYEFVITFPFEKGNEWQGATTTFDILIGFQGKEGGPPPPPPPAGPGLPPGLTISEQSVTTTDITTSSVTITWTTSYLSTSQVIYSRYDQPHTLDLSKPNYGYAYSKEGDDSGSEKVTHHSVTLTGLTPGTTYYFRTVSHGSLAISREYTFTTKGVAGVTTEKPTEEKISPPTEQEISPPTEEIPVEEIPSEKEIPPVQETQPPEVGFTGEQKVQPSFGSLLLASLSVIGKTPWMIVLLILSILGIIWIAITEWRQRKKK
jgi:hypothetical protein